MAQNIVGYANAQQRKDQRRVVEDIYVVIEGGTCKIINISLRSILGTGYKGSAKEEDEIVVEEFLMADDSRIMVNAQAKILRLDATKKEMVAVFLDMSANTYNTLEKMIMLRPVSGKKGRLK